MLQQGRGPDQTRSQCTARSSAAAPRVGPGTVQITLLRMWRRARHHPAQTLQMGSGQRRARVPGKSAACKHDLSSYSLRGSSPRPMAHKTIALTTELREHLKPERVRNSAKQNALKIHGPRAAASLVRVCCGRRADRMKRTRCTVGSSATALRVGPGTVQIALLRMWRCARHQPAQTLQMGSGQSCARAQEGRPHPSTTSAATPCGGRARDLWLIRSSL